MKLKYKTIIFVSFIFLGLIILPNFTKGSFDIAYTFDDNVLIDSAINDFDSTFNLKNSSYYTDHYNATYSFENDVNGNSPIGWTNSDDTNTSSIVINEYLAHSKVIQFSDNSSTGKADIWNDFTPITSGSYEFWFIKPSIASADTLFFQTFNSTFNTNIYVYVQSNDLYYYNGSFLFISENSILPNIWYHLRIDFDDSIRSFNVFLNTELVGINLTYLNLYPSDTIRVRFTTGTSETNYYWYLDAIGFGWNITLTDQTFDFTDDIVGNEPIGWIPNNDPSCTTLINASVDGNTNVLELHNEIAIPFDIANITKTINIIPDMTIEMKITKSDISVGSYDFRIRFRENGAEIIDLQVRQNDIYRLGVKIASNVIIVNEFTMIRLELDDIADTYDLYANSILQTSSIAYLSSTTLGIDTLGFETVSNNYYSCYVDDIYLNPIYYKIGLNLFPYINYTGLKEVDKFEFAMSGPNTLNALSSTTPIGWSLSSEGDGYCVITADLYQPYSDRYVSLAVETDTGVDTAQLHRDLALYGNIVNISINLTEYTKGGNLDIFLIYFKSYSDEFITGLDITGTVLSAYNGSWFTLRNDITTGIQYVFSFMLNYEFDICFFDYEVDGVLVAQYNWSLALPNRYGLGDINIGSISGGSSSWWMIDSIGIYDNGISRNTEYGYATYNIGENWNTQKHNLLFVKANGTFHTGIVQGSYTIGETMLLLSGITDYYNILHTINGYDSDDYMPNSTFVFTVLNHYFNISTFKIDGVILKEGVNEYNLIYEHSGINPDESYFYVVNNIMYFNHISDDSNLEYIQASFDINDENSTDYSISYRSYIEPNAYGYMRVNYTDYSNIIQLPNTLTTTRFILSQERIIRSFIILITDKDNDVITGQTTGYIYNIELLDVLNIQVSVITESLLNMMIPLIIILTPTLIFSKKFGKQVIVPFIILFSLVLTITGMIPYWLFFIIVFPSLVIIFFKSRDDT